MCAHSCCCHCCRYSCFPEAATATAAAAAAPPAPAASLLLLLLPCCSCCCHCHDAAICSQHPISLQSAILPPVHLKSNSCHSKQPKCSKTNSDHWGLSPGHRQALLNVVSKANLISRAFLMPGTSAFLPISVHCRTPPLLLQFKQLWFCTPSQVNI